MNLTYLYVYKPVLSKVSLDWEYDANWAAFTTIALPIVGIVPLHNAKKPSSLAIRINALNAFL